MVTKVGLLDSYAGMIIPTAISLWAILCIPTFQSHSRCVDRGCKVGWGNGNASVIQSGIANV